MDIVPNQNIRADKIQKITKCGTQIRGIRYHFVRYAVYPGGGGRYRHTGIYQCGKFFRRLTVSHLYPRNFYNSILCRIEPRCFQIENYIVLYIQTQPLSLTSRHVFLHCTSH